MTEKLAFRKMQWDDGDNISILFHDVINKKRDLGYWDWKYYRNPAGAHATVVALKGSNIVALIGAIPVKLKVNSTILITSQTTDVVISPAYRDLATFMKLAQIFQKECLKSELRVNYGFSNRASHLLSLNFLNFKEIGPIFNMTKVINPASYLRQKLKTTIVADAIGHTTKYFIKMRNAKRGTVSDCFKVREIRRFDDRFDRFWEREAENHEIAVIRDRQYLNWRYVENPMPYKIFGIEENETIKGFIVLGAYREEEVARGRIVDIMVEAGREDLIQLLITKSIGFFCDQNMDIVVCWMVEHSPIFKILKKYGFFKRKTPHHLIARSDTIGPNIEKLFHLKNWYMTMGDSDYF